MVLVNQNSVLCFTSRPSSSLLSRGMEEEDEEKEDEEEEDEGSSQDTIFNLLQSPECKPVPMLHVFLVTFHRYPSNSFMDSLRSKVQ